jgi:pyruvate/2-oxoglutarate dehydrogenase complex dihydrolipoamide dehydrogenase (E3) component
MSEVDVVVLGLGPGGEAAATRLAQAGLEVVGIDRRLVGGECPYYGCIPSKMAIRAANLLAEGRRIPGRAGRSEVYADWEPVATRIRDEATTDWDDTAAVERLEKAGVTFVRGHGRLTAEATVEVDGRSFHARRGVVLNTGTEPAAPSVPGLADSPFWTNREALRADTLPASLIVIGGGAIGAELAQAFARFGVAVTIVEAAERILAADEPEASAAVAEAFDRDGIAIHTAARVEKVDHAEGRFTVRTDTATLEAERLLVATGRRPNLADVGLDAVGLDPEARAIEVDAWMRAADRLWAIGDITGKGAFTHVSMYQADVAVRDLLDQGGPAADYRAVPRVTFTDPEVGAVGMTEQQARDAGVRVRTGRAPLSYTARGWIHGAGNDGVVKLVEDADAGVLVGATAVGPSGGEVLGLLTAAVHARVPVATLRSMIYAYPTFHRTVEAALDDLG